MKKIIFSILALYLLTGCTDKENATRILNLQGFENISITGYNIFSCGKDDFQHTGFIAYKDGNKVEGTVCSGLIFKDSTIRFK